MNPLSKLFAGLTTARNALYDRGVYKVERLQAPVVSIGNISVGGAGKTPMVIALGQELTIRGIAFDILSRGYRRAKKGTLRLPENADPIGYGDEPALLQKELQGPVFVANSRVDAGKLAESESDRRIHLLDDGFQHRQLHRDFNIVVLAESDLHDRLLPAGRLRETLSALRRADAIVIPEGLGENAWWREVQERSGTELSPWAVRRELVFDDEDVHSAPALAFCGLARPEQFKASLMASGVDCRDLLAFGDHHSYGERDFRTILAKAESVGAELLITTSKDAIKLSRLQLPTEMQRRLRVARLITKIVNAGAVVDQLLGTLQERCPAWFAR